MGIVSEFPESGVRVVLERPGDGGPPWVYDGAAVTPSRRFAMRAVVTEAGEVTVQVDDAAPSDLALRARTMVRTAYKHANDESPGSPPPRRIHRWRGGSGAR